MKFNCVLPDKNNYKYTGLSANKTKHIWEDKQTSLVQIHSTIENPFDQKVGMFFALETGMTRKEKAEGKRKYLKRLILRISELDDNLKTAIIERECIKGQFAYNKDKVVAFAAFLVEYPSHWLYYKLFEEG